MMLSYRQYYAVDQHTFLQVLRRLQYFKYLPPPIFQILAIFPTFAGIAAKAPKLTHGREARLVRVVGASSHRVHR